MNLHEASQALHAFILKDYPDGMPFRDIKHFYQTNPPAGKLIRKRKLKKTCSKDFPQYFFMGKDTVHAKANANFASGMRSKRMDEIALDFYNERLREDPHRKRICEDRNMLELTLNEWKDEQRQKGFHHRGASPSAIIYSLKTSWKLIDEKVEEGQVILWTQVSEKKSRSKEERIAEVAHRVRDARSSMERNRNGIEVDQVGFGLESCDVAVPVGEELTDDVEIRNKSSVSVNVNILPGQAKKRGVRVDSSTLQFDIPPGQKHNVCIAYTPKHIGIMRTILPFYFSSPDQSFSIVRYLSVKAGNPADQEVLKPLEPYQKKKLPKRGEFTNPIPAEIPKKEIGEFARPLLHYAIPNYWRDCITSESVEETLMELFCSEEEAANPESTDFSKKLSLANYSKIFHRLQWTEEVQMEIDIKSYDMTNTPLQNSQGRYSLHIPGLAESRPSVLRGDKILIRFEGKCFQGVVERVGSEDAYLVFSKQFQETYVKGMKVDVRFGFSRMQLRTSHQAIDAVQEGNALIQNILFPDVLKENDARLLSPLSTVSSPDDVHWYNRDLNAEQRSAVHGVMRSVARPTPYLIYGPPGTGKTVTVVECVLQTLKAKGARVLICAPSNMATDLIVQRLAPYIQPEEMLRLMAYSRDKEAVPPEVLKYTHYDEMEQGFTTPSAEVMKQKRVVAVTVSSGGKLPNHDVMGHFTHVFVDEAGHAIEPEVIGCIVDVTARSAPPVVVLAGDPKQLGPIIRSEVAKMFGLDKSLLERLSEREVYKRLDDTSSHYDSRVVTKLVRNYRSHPQILKLPNERFYDRDLIASADHFRSHSLSNWEHLPKRGFPLIFHGVEGEDTREGNSPSWFNPEEAQLVKHYVDFLVKQTRTNRCQPEDIGIVTPYHKQVQKIRLLLDKYGYSDCKVGSVEEFQGSERRVIIISTVRSSVEYIQFDRKHVLGFVSNAKRFNVAVTRAQALLIVVGNPNVLEYDGHWKAFIGHCFENGGYVGCDYKIGEDLEEDDDLVDKLASMDLEEMKEEQKSDDFEMVSHVTAQEGPAWRTEE